MANVFSSGLVVDPDDPTDVLAIVLCPLRLFAPSGDPDELRAVASLIGPVKKAAIRRWLERIASLEQN